MNIDPRNLTLSPTELVIRSDENDADLQGVRICSDVEVKIQITSVDKGWLLDCKAHGQQKLECSRSLQEFASPFDIEFQIFVVNDPKVSGSELDDSEEEIYHLRLHPQEKEFSIAECLRQQILLEEPLNPISDPESSFSWDDPNQPQEDIDPRWAGLLKLKKTDSSESKK